MTGLAQVVIRSATLDDVDGISKLIQSYPDELIARPQNNIIENIERFTVGVIHSEIVSCACWQLLPENGGTDSLTVEIQSVAVKRELKRRGVGMQIVANVLDRIRDFKVVRALVLTFVPEFFMKLGFQEIPPEKIPPALSRHCACCALKAKSNRVSNNGPWSGVKTLTVTD